MARGRKTGGKNIQKGQVLNPNGRPKMSLEMAALTKMSPERLRQLIDKLAELPVAQIQDLMATGCLTILETSICSIWMKAVTDGDHSKLNFILDRSRVGKVKDEIDISVGPRVVYKTTLTADGRLLQDLIRPDDKGELLEGEALQ